MRHIHITLIGKESLPAYYPIAETRPEQVYVIATKQTRQVAERLREVLVTRLSIDCDIYASANAFDPLSVELYCENLHAGFAPDDQVTYNITGGTKLMAIGAYKAALHHGAQIIYTNSDQCIDLETGEATPLALMVDNETIFALQGQQLRAHNVYQPDAETSCAAQAIGAFLRNFQNKSFHSHLVKRSMRSELPHIFSWHGYTYESDSSGLSITRGDSMLLSIDCRNARQLLLEGRWWEVLVADALYDWNQGRSPIWTNVVFVPHENADPEGTRDKNEVDILVNMGSKLLFVECKSGTFNQDNINKLAFVRQNYGSDKSMCVLISYFPVRADMLERAAEAKVSIIAPSKNKGQGMLNASLIGPRLDTIVRTIKA